MSMRLVVNGEAMTVEEGISLAGLVEHLALKIESLVALVNDDVVERVKFSETLLSDGDQVELVTFLPGG
jgi:sulfur carrier protein